MMRVRYNKKKKIVRYSLKKKIVDADCSNSMGKIYILSVYIGSLLDGFPNKVVN